MGTIAFICDVVSRAAPYVLLVVGAIGVLIFVVLALR